MNFLAHLHLSHLNKSEMVGNFIGDYVKGKSFNNYPQEISIGIQLHRRIDSYTDEHEIHRKHKQLFKEAYGLFSGVICDMTYDYLLAKNWSDFSEINLDSFSEDCYRILYQHYGILPQRVQGFLPKMKKAKRLQSYAKLSGIQESIDIMSRYTSLPYKSGIVSQIIVANLSNLEHDFRAFYVDLQRFVEIQREMLTDAKV